MPQSPYDFAPLLENFRAIRDSLHAASDRRFDPIDYARHGFALTSAADTWGINHQRFIAERCAGELSDESLTWHESTAPVWRAFACLALGYLLGLYQTERISDLQFDTADAQLPGFMYLHAPVLETF
ncbi:MAG: hypothetical protein KDA87_08480 [Planctomycetales bacterium]|nr:hypothetical protein [Planctomycetales bacterium]